MELLVVITDVELRGAELPITDYVEIVERSYHHRYVELPTERSYPLNPLQAFAFGDLGLSSREAEWSYPWNPVQAFAFGDLGFVTKSAILVGFF